MEYLPLIQITSQLYACYKNDQDTVLCEIAILTSDQLDGGFHLCQLAYLGGASIVLCFEPVGIALNFCTHLFYLQNSIERY